MNPNEKRMRLLSDCTMLVMEAWANSAKAGVADPMVLLLDDRDGDTLARELLDGRDGPAAAVVSANEIAQTCGKRLAANVERELRDVDTRTLAVLVIAAGGSLFGYVTMDANSRLQFSSKRPGA